MKDSSDPSSRLRWHIGLSSVAKNQHANGGMPSKREVIWLSLFAIVAGLAVFLFFWSRPGFDLEFSRSYANLAGKFPLEADETILGIRWFLLYFMIAFYMIVGACWVRSYVTQKTMLGWTWDKFAFLGTAALIGPVMLVNVLLKGNWGRGRPRDLAEFHDGIYEYTEFWSISGQCSANCSFSSGEVAGISMLFFSVAFLLAAKWRYLLLACGLLVALGASWIRVVMGAHFASDTLMSIVFMMIVVSETYYCFYLQPANWIDWFNGKQRKKLEAVSRKSD